MTFSALPLLSPFVFVTLLTLSFSSEMVFAADARGGTAVEVTGSLTILQSDDFDNRRTKRTYLLEDKKQNKKFELKFEGELPQGLQSGATLRIRGFARGNEIILPADGTGSVQTVAPAVVTVSGEQPTLVMAANFLDVNLSCSTAAIRDMMFTDPADQSIDDFYQETSFGAVWFTGNAVGPYNINYASTDTCDPSAWADAIDAAAQATGVNVSSYVRKVYVLPKNSNCTYAGVGQVGGSPTRAWSFRCSQADVLAHELGHNLGMNHASTPTDQYGDTSDVMGYGSYGLRQVNAVHKGEMGWLSSAQILAVTTSGTYSLAPSEVDPQVASAPQALKILKPDTGEYYYLSYRQPLGFDTNLLSSYVHRLHVHRFKGPGYRTYLLGTFQDGQSFVDMVNNITVTQLSHTSNAVTVQVQLETSCIRSVPTVTLSPASQNGAAGSSRTYTATVTNGDNSSCPASTFDLMNVIPSGWSASASPTALTLSPGQSASATVSVTSAPGALAASYGFTTTAADASVAGHAATASGTYVVKSCIPGAPLVTLSPSSQNGTSGTTVQYSLTVQNTDGGDCPQSTFTLGKTIPSGWTASVSPGTLTLAPGQSGSAMFAVTSPNNASSGTYGATVTASDSTISVHTASKNASYVIPSVGDTQPPTTPTGLTGSGKRRRVSLTWTAATDNVGVVKYEIWRDGVRLADATTTSYIDSAVSLGSSHIYSVVAYDAAGNASSPSNPVKVTVRNK